MTIQENEVLAIINNISDQSVLSKTLTDNDNSNRGVLKTIGLNDVQCDKMLSRLRGYKLIETIDEIEYGLFTRVIKLNNIKEIGDIMVKNVGIAVNCFTKYSKAHERDRILIRFKLGKLFNSVVFEECFMFQKIRDEDQIAMSLVEYLMENK